MNYVIQHLRHVTECKTTWEGTEFSASNEISYVLPNDNQKFSRKPFRSSKYLSHAKLFANPEVAKDEAIRLIRFGGMNPVDVKILAVDRTVRFPNDSMKDATVIAPVVIGNGDKIYSVEKTLVYKYGDLRAKDGNTFYTIFVLRPGYDPWFVTPGTDVRDDFFRYSGNILEAVKFSTKEMCVEAFRFYMDNCPAFHKTVNRYNYTVGVIDVKCSNIMLGDKSQEEWTKVMQDWAKNLDSLSKPAETEQA